MDVIGIAPLEGVISKVASIYSGLSPMLQRIEVIWMITCDRSVRTVTYVQFNKHRRKHCRKVLGV